MICGVLNPEKILHQWLEHVYLPTFPYNVATLP